MRSLAEYYDKESLNPESEIPSFGFERKKITHIIVINENGNPIAIKSTYENVKKNKDPKQYSAPQSVIRTSGTKSNFLYDKIEYALGINGNYKQKEKEHRAFINKIKDANLLHNKEIEILLKFLENKNKISDLSKIIGWEDLITDKTAIISFKIAGDAELIFEKQIIKNFIKKNFEADKGTDKCIITGETGTIVETHHKIKNFPEVAPTGVSLFSCNKKSGEFRRKKQGNNFPIIKKTEFKIATALDFLLRKKSNQKIQIAKTTIVFFLKEKMNKKNNFCEIFRETFQDSPNEKTKSILNLYSYIKNGIFNITKEENDLFTIIGFSTQGKYYIVNDFIIKNTIFNIAKKISNHIEDIKITHADNKFKIVSPKTILLSIYQKAENIPSMIESNFLQSILNGTNYPQRMFQSAIIQNRVINKNEIKKSYQRISFIKGYMNRKNRKEVIKMSLDTENQNIGYLLGRLFAVLEKIYLQSHSKSDLSFAVKYRRVASTTPQKIFSHLMNMKDFHLAKINSLSSQIFFQKIINEIFDKEPEGFPKILNLELQGYFHMGYHHQTNQFYKKGKNNDEN